MIKKVCKRNLLSLTEKKITKSIIISWKKREVHNDRQLQILLLVDTQKNIREKERERESEMFKKIAINFYIMLEKSNWNKLIISFFFWINHLNSIALRTNSDANYASFSLVFAMKFVFNINICIFNWTLYIIKHLKWWNSYLKSTRKWKLKPFEIRERFQNREQSFKHILNKNTNKRHVGDVSNLLFLISTQIEE